MHKVKLGMIIGGVLLVLGSIQTLMDHGSKVGTLRADGGPTVTIAAPLPLPTTAAQNGAWNVGITGSPTVTVGNTVSTLDAERLARIPFQSFVTIACTDPGTCSSQYVSSSSGVPAGHRLVIQHVSGYFYVPLGTAPGPFMDLYDYNHTPKGHWYFVGRPGSPFGSSPTKVTFTVNEDVLAYFDSPQAPGIDVDGQSSVVNGNVTVTGYLESCVVTGCPAIAP